MSVTLDDIERRVRSRLSESDVDFFTSQNVLDWVNEGQDVIANAVPFTVQTTWQTLVPPNAVAIQLTEECLQPTGAVLQRGNGAPIRLDYVEPDVMDGWKSNRSTRRTGTANYCTVRTRLFGRMLEWEPTLSVTATLTVEGHMRPRTLAATTDTTDIPSSLAHVIVDYVLWQAKKKDEESGEAEQAQRQFAADLEKLQARRIIEQADQFNRTRGHRGLGRRMFGWG